MRDPRITDENIERLARRMCTDEHDDPERMVRWAYDYDTNKDVYVQLWKTKVDRAYELIRDHYALTDMLAEDPTP